MVRYLVLFSFLFHAGISFSETVNICDRSYVIQKQIRKAIAELRGETGPSEQVDCGSIHREELENISFLVIKGQKDQPLVEPKPQDFKHLSNLIYLDLGGNQIRHLDENIFSDLKSLEGLNLSNNQLQELRHALDPLVSLKHLFLYGNDFSVSIHEGSLERPFSNNMFLERIILSQNGLESIPAGLFENNKQLKTIALHAEVPLFHDPMAPSEMVQRVAGEIEKMALKYWHLPFGFQVNYAPYCLDEARQKQPIGGLGRAIEEIMAIRALQETKEAYRTTPFDFYGVEIEFRVEGVDLEHQVLIQKDNAFVHVALPMPMCAQTLKDYEGLSPVETGQILDALSKDFNWKREARWYRQVDRRTQLAALHRDFGKVVELQQQLARYMNSLKVLVDEVFSRRERTGENFILFQYQQENARLLQFKTMFALQRLLNTLARWRSAFDDPTFAHPHEVGLLTYSTAAIFHVYLNLFLRTITDTDRIGTGYRNPFFKIMDEALGGRSIEIPAGSVVGLLYLRRDVELYTWFREVKLRFKNNSDRHEHGEGLTQEMRPLKKVLDFILEMLQQEDNIMTAARARDLINEAATKNRILGGIYVIQSKIAEWVGDTRAIHARPAISDAQLARLELLLRPGDIILERKDWYLSNTFLPGFWPHAELYLGPMEEWGSYALGEYGKTLGYTPHTPLREITSIQEQIKAYASGRGYRVIEAVSEGVLYSAMAQAVQADYVAVLRPLFENEEQRKHGVARAIYSALRFLGKPYDFEFDFNTDDKMVCTELIYQAYDWHIGFSAQKKAPAGFKPVPPIPGVVTLMGRETMPAQEMARLVDFMHRHPSPLYAPDGRLVYPGNRLKLEYLVVKDEALTDNQYHAVEYEGEDALGWFRAHLFE